MPGPLCRIGAENGGFEERKVEAEWVNWGLGLRPAMARASAATGCSAGLRGGRLIRRFYKGPLSAAELQTLCFVGLNVPGPLSGGPLRGFGEGIN